jgi:hypothetical protein
MQLPTVLTDAGRGGGLGQVGRQTAFSGQVVSVRTVRADCRAVAGPLIGVDGAASAADVAWVNATPAQPSRRPLKPKRRPPPMRWRLLKVSDLEKLAELRGAEVLTNKEFLELKRCLLGR